MPARQTVRPHHTPHTNEPCPQPEDNGFFDEADAVFGQPFDATPTLLFGGLDVTPQSIIAVLIC